ARAPCLQGTKAQAPHPAPLSDASGAPSSERGCYEPMLGGLVAATANSAVACEHRGRVGPQKQHPSTGGRLAVAQRSAPLAPEKSEATHSPDRSADHDQQARPSR